jgi:hypothetical protein
MTDIEDDLDMMVYPLAKQVWIKIWHGTFGSAKNLALRWSSLTIWAAFRGEADSEVQQHGHDELDENIPTRDEGNQHSNKVPTATQQGNP